MPLFVAIGASERAGEKVFEHTVLQEMTLDSYVFRG